MRNHQNFELRRAERGGREALATEGYFDPRLRFEPVSGESARYRMIIELGPLTRVGSVELKFNGEVSEPAFAQRARELRAACPLKPGTPFRAADWEQAKLRLLASTEERNFAGARLVDSIARVRPETATADLVVELDSGPPYTVGALQIQGLSRYESSLVEHYNPFKPGDPYDRQKLVEFQQALQDTPFFANALATLQLAPETRLAALPEPRRNDTLTLRRGEEASGSGRDRRRTMPEPEATSDLASHSSTHNGDAPPSVGRGHYRYRSVVGA